VQTLGAQGALQNLLATIANSKHLRGSPPINNPFIDVMGDGNAAWLRIDKRQFHGDASMQITCVRTQNFERLYTCSACAASRCLWCHRYRGDGHKQLHCYEEPMKTRAVPPALLRCATVHCMLASGIECSASSVHLTSMISCRPSLSTSHRIAYGFFSFRSMCSD
jgi:hypothetical protein